MLAISETGSLNKKDSKKNKFNLEITGKKKL